MGRPNWMRSSAWVRASSSMARPAPTSSCPRASCPSGHRGRPVGRPARCAAHAVSNSPMTSNRPSAGSRPCTGRRVSRPRSDGEGAGAVGRLGHDERGVGSGRAPRSRVLRRHTSPRPDARGSQRRSGGRTTARSGCAVGAERGGQQPVERGRGRRVRAPGLRRARDTAAAPVGRQRVAPSEVVERGVERGTVARLGGVRGRRSRRAPRSVASITGRPRGRAAAGR